MNAKLLNPGSVPSPRILGPLTRTDFVRYQGASGDMNPIHHDEPFAISSGYPAPLAVGMFTAGVMTTWATDWLGPQNVRRTRIRWVKPCFPGMVITISGELVETRETPDHREIDLAITAKDAENNVVLQLWMTFHVRGEIPETASPATNAELPTSGAQT